MATTIKNLGQVAPLATTETDLYTVPGATSTVCSSLVVCNTSGSTATFRISHSVGGGVTATKDYLYYEVTLAGYDTFIATVGITLAATDKIRVYASSANVAFNLYGQEST